MAERGRKLHRCIGSMIYFGKAFCSCSREKPNRSLDTWLEESSCKGVDQLQSRRLFERSSAHMIIREPWRRVSNLGSRSEPFSTLVSLPWMNWGTTLQGCRSS